MLTETQARIKQIAFEVFFITRHVGCLLSWLTASPSLHFQLPLSMGFLRFSPIQNQCCSCSSDSLWGHIIAISLTTTIHAIINVAYHLNNNPHTHPKASCRICNTNCSSSGPLMLSRLAPCFLQKLWARIQVNFCSSWAKWNTWTEMMKMSFSLINSLLQILLIAERIISVTSGRLKFP